MAIPWTVFVTLVLLGKASANLASRVQRRLVVAAGQRGGVIDAGGTADNAAERDAAQDLPGKRMAAFRARHGSWRFTRAQADQQENIAKDKADLFRCWRYSRRSPQTRARYFCVCGAYFAGGTVRPLLIVQRGGVRRAMSWRLMRTPAL